MIFFVICVFLILITVFTAVFINRKSFNEEIQGIPYKPSELLLPEAPPTPEPTQPPPEYPVQSAGRYAPGFPDRKTVYLTFDDGPSEVTLKILDILKEKNVKATFFVLGHNARLFPEILKRTAKEGHLIGNHSYSHDYENLYNDTDFFINDIMRAEELLISLVGTDSYTKVFRFPGGSFEKYKAKKADILTENDFSFIDWNASNGDAEGHDIPKEQLVLKAIETSGQKNTVVLLMHDSERKHTTVSALPEIIDYYKQNGYYFAVLKR